MYVERYILKSLHEIKYATHGEWQLFSHNDEDRAGKYYVILPMKLR